MKTLLVQNRGFGDVMWTEPIVRHFLSEQEKVSIFTSYPCIFDNYPNQNLYINQMEKLLPLQEAPISLQLGEKPQMHLLECFREQAGIPNMELSLPQIHLSTEEKKGK